VAASPTAPALLLLRVLSVRLRLRAQQQQLQRYAAALLVAPTRRLQLLLLLLTSRLLSTTLPSTRQQVGLKVRVAWAARHCC
jgi:hypothetical protein